MDLAREILLTDRFDPTASTDYRATISAHGLYSTNQFVLRLSPIVHRTLSSHPQGIASSNDGQYLQAMSTYLHETVHWWQHIGSTYGFLFSLNYPVQSHCTHQDLKELISLDGFKKSVRQQSLGLNARYGADIATPAGRANRIVNNHFDLLTYRAFTLGPKVAEEIVQKDLFETVGHAMHMTYAHTVGLLAATADPAFEYLSDPRSWTDGFKDLSNRKVEGHYYGSRVGIYPVGALEIFEGQARFSQIQFLSHANGHRLSWDDLRGAGMLSGVYIKAFEEFLRLSENAWPNSVHDPLVGLFLLVCDLSVNPASGFPASVAPNFESFLLDVNPGARFCTFCRLVAREYPELSRAIRKYDRSEYSEVSEILAKGFKEVPPLLIAKFFSTTFSKPGVWAGLRREYETYTFESGNFVIRHLFAHFLAFQEDKFRSPEFFCWPGAWTAGSNVTSDKVLLFEKHSALFVDKEDNDGVFPRTQSHRDEARVQATFDEFYRNAVVYDLVDQWISREGPFQYQLGWLVAAATPAEMSTYMRSQFRSAFELDPRDVHLLA